MNFEALVDQKVQVEARVGNIGRSRHSNDVVINLFDVYVNGEYFRDHSYIKMTKRLSDVLEDDLITATATLIRYPSVATGKMDKLGLKSFRNVKIHSKNS